MKKSRFTYSQTIAVLKQAEAGTPVPEAAVASAPSTRGGNLRALQAH